MSEKLMELDLTMEKEVDRGAERIKGTRVPGMARIVQVWIQPPYLLSPALFPKPRVCAQAVGTIVEQVCARVRTMKGYRP